MFRSPHSPSRWNVELKEAAKPLVSISKTSRQLRGRVKRVCSWPEPVIQWNVVLLTHHVECNAVGIADGDVLTSLVNDEQLRIRLSDLDTPERKQPFGNRTKQALSELIFEK